MKHTPSATYTALLQMYQKEIDYYKKEHKAGVPIHPNTIDSLTRMRSALEKMVEHETRPERNNIQHNTKP